MKKILGLFVCAMVLIGCSSNTSQKVENGDVVKIDFEGSMNGEVFDGGSANDAMLEIGSKTFIDGFEEQLVGMKTGEEKTITVTFPKEYYEELAGKEAQFKVKLHKIYREVK